MERLTGNNAKSLLEAYSEVYHQEVQVEILSEEVEQLDEQGQTSGRNRMAAAMQQRNQQNAADAAAIKAAEMKAGGGQAAVQQNLQQRYGGRMPSARQLARHSSGASAARSVAATGRENLFRGGGGEAAMAKGLTRQQVMAQGAKNFQAKQASAAKPAPAKTADTAPAKPAGGVVADKVTKPAVPTGTTASGQKFERRLPTMAELRAAQAARAAAKAAGKTGAEAEAAAVKAGVQAGKPKPVGTPVQGGVKPVAGAPTASAANTKFGVSAKPLGSPAPVARPAAQPTVQQRIQQGGAAVGARPTTNQTGTAFRTSGSLAPGANRIAAQPATRKEPLFGPGSPGYGAGRPKPKPAVKRDEPLW